MFDSQNIVELWNYFFVMDVSENRHLGHLFLEHMLKRPDAICQVGDLLLFF